MQVSHDKQITILKISKNEMLVGLFGQGTNEIITEQKQLHKQELHNFYASLTFLW
jgi:hypothetical protein